MKIIFLDIDGVLNVIPQGYDKYGCTFHKHFIENLDYIIQNTDAKIVISSTWRFNGLKEMQDMWINRNLPGDVIDITPYLGNNVKRGDEINDWLMNNQSISNYVIIDDDDDMLPQQYNNFVKTSDNIEHDDCVDIGYGLTKECAELAIKILNKL